MRLHRSISLQLAKLAAIFLSVCAVSHAIQLGPTTSALNLQAFAEEMRLAETATDRDSRVKHLLAAVSYRPDDPGNAVIEFRAAIELSERIDKAHGQGIRPLEALSILDALLNKYDHRAYYSDYLMDSIDSPSLVVPRAAILAASIRRGAVDDVDGALRDLERAMDELKWTAETRRTRWGTASAPAKPEPPQAGPMEMAKWETRIADWQKKRDDAASGKVFGDFEMEFVRAAVRQYGLCFGKQRPEDVPAVMQKIIDRYPNTPMAVVAEEHIGKATALLDKERVAELPHSILPQSPGAEARTSRKDRLIGTAFLFSGIAAILYAMFLYREKRRKT